MSRPPKWPWHLAGAALAAVKAEQTWDAGGTIREVAWWPLWAYGFLAVSMVMVLAALFGRGYPSAARTAGLVWALVWCGRGFAIFWTFGAQFPSTVLEHVAIGAVGAVWFTQLELWRDVEQSDATP